MTVLLHTCCASCLIIPFDDICASSGEEPVVYFYNPNIHPYKEFRKRIQAIKDYSTAINIEKKIIIDEDYQVESYLAKIINRPQGTDRCSLCYQIRLETAARKAIEKGISKFTTTLFVSPYQNHKAIIEAGLKIAERYSIEFIVNDWRGRYHEGIQRAKQSGFYMQAYCGCIFSEEERFRKAAMKKRLRQMDSVCNQEDNIL